MCRLKALLSKKPRPSSPAAASPSLARDDANPPVPLSSLQLPPASSGSFKSLVDRSIAAWKSMTYVGITAQKEGSLNMASSVLERCSSIEDLASASYTFWFFQRRDSFMREEGFLKWNPNRLDDYVLLPVALGFVNKPDCYFVSHYWRTKDHPDPRGEDYRLIRQDLANSTWSYVWIDWTCLPQAPRTGGQEAYATKMLHQASLLPRDCAFESRYQAFEPRLWILTEVASYMLTTIDYTVTDDLKPFVNDVLAMQKEGVLEIIRKRGYTCSEKRDLRVLIGWLELLVIMTELIADIPERRLRLETMEMSSAGSWIDYTTGISVDKTLGIVAYNKAVYRFAPLYPRGPDGLPPVLPEPGYCEPPPCVDEITEIMQRPELSSAREQVKEKEESLGADHKDTLVAVERLGDVFAELKQFTEADFLHHRVVEGLKKTLGLDHPQTLDVMKRRALLLDRYKRTGAERDQATSLAAAFPPPAATTNNATAAQKGKAIQKPEDSPEEDDADMKFELRGLHVSEGEAPGTGEPVLEHFLAPTPIRPSCSMCGRPATKVCSGCRSSRYCSFDCRADDWPAHKLLCRAFKAALTPPISPEPGKVILRRAILFPARAHAPRLIWLKCVFHRDGYWDDRAGWFLGESHPMEDRILVERNLVQERDVPGGGAIDIVFCDDFYYESPSLSIHAATGGRAAHQWCGNVVVVRNDARDPVVVGDATMEDYRHAVDFFLSYSGRVGKGVFRKKAQARKVIWTESSPFRTTTLVS